MISSASKVSCTRETRKTSGTNNGGGVRAGARSSKQAAAQKRLRGYYVTHSNKKLGFCVACAPVSARTLRFEAAAFLVSARALALCGFQESKSSKQGRRSAATLQLWAAPLTPPPPLRGVNGSNSHRDTFTKLKLKNQGQADAAEHASADLLH